MIWEKQRNYTICSTATCGRKTSEQNNNNNNNTNNSSMPSQGGGRTGPRESQNMVKAEIEDLKKILKVKVRAPW